MIHFLNKHSVIFLSRYYSFSFFLLLIVAAAGVSSCKLVKPVGYFQHLERDTVIAVAPLPLDEIKIKKGDVIAISVSSLNKEEDEIFNAKKETSTGVAGSIGGGLDYEVGSEGEIYLHRLGKVEVAGLTRKQLKLKLEKELQPYFKDPVVVVAFSNHIVTVLGQIGNPQVIRMPAERLSIIEVIGQTGNTVSIADLSNVILVRDSTSTLKMVKHLNLKDHTVFNSPYFYLQPNDLVVVNPNEEAAVQDQKRLKYQQVSTIVFQVVTLGILFYQAFFK